MSCCNKCSSAQGNEKKPVNLLLNIITNFFYCGTGFLRYFRPIFFGFISWTLPTGLVVYFLTGNIFRIGQQALIVKLDDREEVKKEEKKEDNNEDTQSNPIQENPRKNRKKRRRK